MSPQRCRTSGRTRLDHRGDVIEIAFHRLSDAPGFPFERVDDLACLGEGDLAGKSAVRWRDAEMSTPAAAAAIAAVCIV
ncbi:hypothetical protein GOC72_00320 [Sinorhizobium medicae]|nr:hypothetical protein [Sinorhizobium medicae]MBO1961526.1 hypothetical protein [Sinorhizobium medicae]MDX0451903.1 hypothetical protein [Sinorhizobium medicae]MDX0520037.1 hypothetical protein [Sinorhizobium medicae]MDX1199912.1 hypothetical protein [Sinorhizobium medicae]WQO56199.1 hypothetical protein U8C36_28690 [Sinorhizobium medicae]